MAPVRRTAVLALVWAAFAVSSSAPATAAPAPDVEARTDRDPDPGENFTLTFRLASHQTANYTILVSPRPEFAFNDLSNGSRRMPVENGSAAEFNFEMSVSRSARSGTYAVSYTVLREDATVKMGTLDVKVGGLSACSSFIILLPAVVIGAAAACSRRPGR
jgi:hypothetical protein